jgi:hypothetical protein
MKILTNISPEISDFLILLKDYLKCELTIPLYKALKVLETENKVYPKTFINVFGSNNLNGELGIFIKTFHGKTKITEVFEIEEITNTVLLKSVKSSHKFLKNKSFGSKLFHFQIHEVYECNDCEYKTHRFNEDFILDTLVTKDNPVDFKLKGYFNNKDYSYKECENCGKEGVDVEHIVYRSFSILPEILIIKKNNSSEYPDILDCSGYSEMNCKDTVFDFIGDTCEHFIYKKNIIKTN